MNMLQRDKRPLKFKFKHTIRSISIHFLRPHKGKEITEKLKSLGQPGNSVAVELSLQISKNKLFCPGTSQESVTMKQTKQRILADFSPIFKTTTTPPK